ncbi:hypothetical protein ACI2KR_08180 [Pseudomonas luteola]
MGRVIFRLIIQYVFVKSVMPLVPEAPSPGSCCQRQLKLVCITPCTAAFNKGSAYSIDIYGFIYIIVSQPVIFCEIRMKREMPIFRASLYLTLGICALFYLKAISKSYGLGQDMAEISATKNAMEQIGSALILYSHDLENQNSNKLNLIKISDLIDDGYLFPTVIEKNQYQVVSSYRLNKGEIITMAVILKATAEKLIPDHLCDAFQVPTASSMGCSRGADPIDTVVWYKI